MSINDAIGSDAARRDPRTDDSFVITTADENPSVADPVKRRPVNVFIAHKSILLTEGLGEVLSRERDFRVAGTASDSENILRCVGRLHNCVVLLDSAIGSEDPALLQALVSAGAGIRVVLLMATPDDQQILQALRMGVRGVILESMGSRLLISCIRKVHAGEEWIEQASARRLLHRFALQDGSESGTILSRREVQVVRGIARGLTNRQIGKELFINAATVKTHVHNVFRKLNVSNRVSVNNYARTHGLI